ncbi:MAG: GNAT family protein [Pseudomonadota bacterium]
MSERLDAPLAPLAGVSLAMPVPSDEAGFRRAADSEETWRWYSYRADGPHFDTQFWPRYLADHRPPDEVHWAVRFRGEIVGSTCFLAVDAHHRRLEIGGTWYQESVRGSVVNPAAKRLLMARAFAWGARRVEWKTDAKNARSRAAIEKLGAQFEGIHRNHMRLHDGRSRDTAYYAMVPSEWPGACARLDRRIARLASA